MLLDLKVEHFSPERTIELFTQTCQALELVAHFTDELDACLTGVIDCTQRDQILDWIQTAKNRFTAAAQERSRQLDLLAVRAKHIHLATTTSREELDRLKAHAEDKSYLSDAVIGSTDEFVTSGTARLSNQQWTLRRTLLSELALL